MTPTTLQFCTLHADIHPLKQGEKESFSYPAPGFYTAGSDVWYHKIIRATGEETQTCFSSLFPQDVLDGHVPDEFGLKHQGWLKAQLFPCLSLSEVRLTKSLSRAHQQSCEPAYQKDSQTQRWEMPGRQLLTTSSCQKPQTWKSSCYGKWGGVAFGFISLPMQQWPDSSQQNNYTLLKGCP